MCCGTVYSGTVYSACVQRVCTAYMYNFVLKLTRCTRQETPDPAHVSGPLYRGKGDDFSRLGYLTVGVTNYADRGKANFCNITKQLFSF